jgi:thiol-disulfide isomerase/thioredoxin
MIQKIQKNLFWIGLAAVSLYFIGKYLYAKPRFVNGESAPDFTAMTAQNASFQLAQLRGSYILLDFWGSWCGPCIQEAPQLKNLYSQFKNTAFTDAQSFEIVSIGIEKDETRWRNAIKSLGIDAWTHASDFRYMDSPIALQYGVRTVPTKYLLNTEGVIIGVNQSIEEIEAFLKSKMK